MPIGHKIRYAGVNHSSVSFSSSAMEHKTMPNIWPAATYLSTAGINRWQDQWVQIPGIRHLEKNWFICSIFFPALAENTGRIFTVKATANQARRDMWVPSPCSDKKIQPEKEVSRGLFGGRLLQREQVLQIWHKQGWCFVRWPFHTSKPIYLQPIKENKLWKPPFLWQYGVHWSDSPTDFKEWVGEPD